MDWMDDYLNGMGEYKVTVSPADTHQWGPAKPGKQQQSMIQDAMAFDIQQMRLIQEARQELEKHGASLGIGADPGSPTVQTPDTGAWLTRKIYTEFLGGYGVPHPTYTQLSDAIATWTPVTIDAPTNYVFANFPEGTWEFTGYFVAPENGLYSFSASRDDYSFISFGAPVTINNSAHITLQAGEAVPLRILAANVAGPGLLTLLWKNDASQTSNTSNFAGLVYSQLPAGAPVVDPVIPADALQLWLKADAGITKNSYNYVAQITITGASTPDVSGTYVASTVPTFNYEDNALNNYQLDGPDGKTMNWNIDDALFTAQGFQSSDGASWSITEPIVTQITVTGLTGVYAAANGTYNGTPGRWDRDGGYFFIDGEGLKDIEYENLIATPPNSDFAGSWTPTSYVSTVIVAGAGTTSANGTYTRPDTVDNESTFFASEDRTISSNSSDWFIGDLYYAGSISGPWGILNGDPDAPTTTVQSSPRSIGSATSTSVIIPSGTIAGTVSSATVNTQLLDSWADQSGNGRNAGPNSYIRPSFVTIGGTQAFVSFPANADLATSLEVLASYTGTMFVVSRFPPVANNAFVSLFFREESFVLAKGDANTMQVTNDGVNFVYSNMQVNSNTNYILETTFDNALANVYINGMATGSGPIGDAPIASNAFIGNDGQASFIAEVIAYTRVLTTAERQKVEAYLAQKYAITLIVPSCTDAEASVTMTGWTVGDRTLAPTNYAPYGYPNYEYGGEVVRYETGVWIYSNVDEGEIVRAYSYEPRPWLATWPQGYTASKVCPS
jgi:hypothetical protein